MTDDTINNARTVLDFWQIWAISIGPAALTALVALLVPWVSSWIAKRDVQRKTRSERLEGLIVTVYEYESWVDGSVESMIFGDERKFGVTPIARIEATVHLYFPDAQNAVDALKLEAAKFRKWATSAGELRLAGTPDYLNGYKEARIPFASSLRALLDELLAIARKV